MAPKAEEEGAESSSSEANGPIGGAATNSVVADGGGSSDVGMIKKMRNILICSVNCLCDSAAFI